MQVNHEVIDPVIGQSYLVKVCIYHNYNYGRIVSVPVIGDVHADKEFSASAGHQHLHIDARFTSKFLDRVFNIDTNGNTNHVLFLGRIPDYQLAVKRRVCKRLVTCINPPKDYDKYNVWYRKYHGVSCKGRICPHRGTTMHKYGDGLRCPLHGLKAGPGEFVVPNWNMEEGVAS